MVFNRKFNKDHISNGNNLAIRFLDKPEMLHTFTS